MFPHFPKRVEEVHRPDRQPPNDETTQLLVSQEDLPATFPESRPSRGVAEGPPEYVETRIIRASDGGPVQRLVVRATGGHTSKKVPRDTQEFPSIEHFSADE